MSAATDFTWPLANATTTQTYQLLEGIRINSVSDYLWMVILGGFLAFAMAWGIGANDVANAFATSVGAGSLTLRQACLIASVMEFLGALLMGANVTDTVRKKVIDVDRFDPVNGGATNGPELLMTGFLVSLMSATTWLITATYFSLPVSTTHSIIGSLIGVGLTFRGAEAVVWLSDGTGLDSLKGVVGVVISWVISPVLSGVLGVILFLIVRHTVLRTKNPVRNGFIFLPFFTTLTVAIIIFFIIYKGSPRLKLGDRFSVGEAVGIALGTGAVLSLLEWWFVVPLLKRWIDRWEDREIQKLKNPEDISEATDRVNSALGKVGINFEIDEELDDDVIRMHDNVEKFDPKAEKLFSWLQVLTAAFDAFAHGANDVANSIGPFASIYSLYQSRGVISERTEKKYGKNIRFQGGASDGQVATGQIRSGNSYCGKIGDQEFYRCAAPENVTFPHLSGPHPNARTGQLDLYDKDGKLTKTNEICHSACNLGNYVKYNSRKQSVEIWILVLGGVGIILGLVMWGYRIIVAIGVKLTKLTPSRGFSIELGAAITVLIASRLGLPVSTTHCQVGATMGVGLVEFKGNTVNWKQFFFICVGWVFTVVFTALLAAGIFAVLINTPQEYSDTQPGLPKHCPGQNMFVYDRQGNGFRGISCSGVDFDQPDNNL